MVEISRFAGAIATVSLVLCGVLMGWPMVVSASPLEEPLVIENPNLGSSTEWSASLTIEAYRHITDDFSFTTRAYCYEGQQCSVPGPTIQLRPGEKFTLHITNKLGPESSASSSAASSASSYDHTATTALHNSLHAPNTTNVHTHGLHVDPNVDRIFLTAAPGESITYEYLIPPNHAPGLHWYHSHMHGATSLQVQGGLYGAIIIVDDRHGKGGAGSSNIPTSITNKPTILLAISQIKFDDDHDGNSLEGTHQSPYSAMCLGDGTSTMMMGDSDDHNMHRFYSLPELSRRSHSNLDVNFIPNSDAVPYEFHMVNGQYNPSVTILGIGQPHILRIGYFSSWKEIELKFNNDNNDDGDSNPNTSNIISYAAIIAIDGVYLDAPCPISLSSPGTTTTRTLPIVAASRVDLIITCASTGIVNVVDVGYENGGKEVFQLVCTEKDEEEQMASSSSVSSSLPTTEEMNAIVRPEYLTNLQSSHVDDTYTIRFVHNADHENDECGFFVGAGPDCKLGETPSTTDSNCKFMQFVGERGNTTDGYTADSRLVTRVGHVNEWKLFGPMPMGMMMDSTFHTLHLHVSHFQIISMETPTETTSSSMMGGDGGGGGGMNHEEGQGNNNKHSRWEEFFKVGDWRDTVPVMYGALTARFVPHDFAGEYMIHCHLLRHGDLGMMDSFLVLPAKGEGGGVDSSSNSRDYNSGSPSPMQSASPSEPTPAFEGDGLRSEESSSAGPYATTSCCSHLILLTGFVFLFSILKIFII